MQQPLMPRLTKSLVADAVKFNKSIDGADEKA